MKKVIVLSARELGYQIIRALGKYGIGSIVICGNKKDEIAQYSKYVIESYKIPFFKNPDSLLRFLMKKGEAWNNTLIFPGEDYGVKFLAENKEELSKHYIVPTPEINIINNIISKKTIYKLAEEIGIGVPKILSPNSLDELAELEHQIDFPCLLKPGLGHLFTEKFGTKMIETHNYDELLANYKRFTNNFENDDFELMICEIIPGQDSKYMIQYTSYVDQSRELLAAMASRKLRQDPPEYGQGRVVKSVRANGIQEESLRLLRKLEYYGFSEIEWKYDPRDGFFKLIEINPRFTFYIGLCVACGINFPYVQYLDLVQNRKMRVDSYKENVYWIHLYKDILHTLLHHKMENITVKEYIAPYLGKKVYTVLNFKDPKPFYWQWKQHIWNIFRKS